MDYAQRATRPGRHTAGIGIVLAMHLALGWALLNGLAQRMVEAVRAPLETRVIEEVKPPPPPPPENLPPPKFAPPPPSFAPPPEVNVTPPPAPAPTITTATTPPLPGPVMAAPAPTPAAPAAGPVRTEPKLDFGVCAKPEYTAASRRAEAQGTVVVAFTMDTDGAITDARIEKSAGPSREQKALDRATLEAVLACKGKPGTLDGRPEKLASRVAYVWKLTD
jgi:protein TonB